MFKTAFIYLSSAYDITVQWTHIHGSGLFGITVDQDLGCIKGKALLII